MTYKQFAGLRNVVSSERFEPGDLEAAVNVDLDDSGRAARRKGQTLKLAGAPHSLWADGVALYVESTSLKTLSSGYAATVLASGYTAGATMRYQRVNNRVYFSNHYQTGVLDSGAVRTWGIVPPVHVGIASQVAGQLPAGTYQWTLTYLRSDGQESGALATGRIVLEDNSGLAFSALPVSSDAGVVAKIIYLTPCNGDSFYEALTLDNADTTATYVNDGTELTRPIETMWMREAPAGQEVGYFRGHMLVADGENLYPSEPYGFELFDRRKYLPFDSNITLIAPVEDGVYIGTERAIYFLLGGSPDEWVRTTKAEYGAIPYTLSYTSGALIGEGMPGSVALWLSAKGVCAGANQGGFTNLNDSRMDFDITGTGAGIISEGRYLATVR